MKIRFLVPFLAAIASSAAIGQSPSPSATPLVAAPVRARTAPFSAADRGSLIAAGEKIRKDPKVIAAAAKMHAAMLAVNAVMVAKDPSLGPILDKIQAASVPHAVRTPLTPDDRQKLRAARDAMKGTPEGAAWLQATMDYRAAVREAMLTADPGISNVLNKLPQPGVHVTGAAITSGSAASPSASPGK